MKNFHCLLKTRFFSLIPIIIFTMASTAWASSEIQALFLKQYKTAVGTKLDSCATCHSPNVSEGLNSYGLLLKITKLDFVGAEDKDSDHDGTSNGAEIAAESFPGSQAVDEGLFVFKTIMGTDPWGSVTFAHGSHNTEEKYGINGKCTICHDDSAAKFFPRLVDDSVTMMDVAHDICLGCHKNDPNKIAPRGCQRCHIQ